MQALRDNPVLFATEILEVTPDDWQAEALTAVKNNSRTAIRSGHG